MSRLIICGCFNLLVYFDNVKLFYVLDTGIIDLKLQRQLDFMTWFFSLNFAAASSSSPSSSSFLLLLFASLCAEVYWGPTCAYLAIWISEDSSCYYCA